MRTLILVVLSAVTLLADDVVFVGSPTIRFDADGRATNPHELTSDGAQKGSSSFAD